VLYKHSNHHTHAQKDTRIKTERSLPTHCLRRCVCVYVCVYECVLVCERARVCIHIVCVVFCPCERCLTCLTPCERCLMCHMMHRTHGVSWSNRTHAVRVYVCVYVFVLVCERARVCVRINIVWVVFCRIWSNRTDAHRDTRTNTERSLRTHCLRHIARKMEWKLVCVRICVFMYVYVDVYLCMCIYKCTKVYVYVYVCACMCTCMCTWKSMCTFMCVCVRVRVCVCVGVSYEME